jgi:hypothetical protein
LFSFCVVCGDMISKGFGLVAFFASVKASSICIHLSCLVCVQFVVHGIRSRLFCDHKGCSLLRKVKNLRYLNVMFFTVISQALRTFLPALPPSSILIL